MLKQWERSQIISLLIMGSIVLAAFFVGKAHAACSITVINTNDSGVGSFRQAMLSANSASDTDTICFSIGSGYKTISPTTVLPALSYATIIDGSTQPGFTDRPLIEINGSGAGGGTSGIQINGGGSTVRSLIVNRFGNDGIILYGGSGNTIVGNYVGTDANGTSDFGNGSSGVGTLNSSNNTIGGTIPADRNIISGNNGAGISIAGIGSTGNTVKGNYIGTEYTGTFQLPNTVDGILLASSAGNNTVGGTVGVTPGGDCTGACNLISGNGANGVGLGQTGAGSTIVGNYIGVDSHGTNTIPNFDIGVEAQDAPDNRIGGTTPQERNIISANGGAGVSINGTASTGNTLSGNFIGTDVSGSVAMGNHKMGVNLGSPSGGSNNASSNTIGGTTGVSIGGSCTGSCNVISANHWSGIYISGTTGGSNQIIGNFIGSSVSGGLTRPNLMDGIGIVDSSNNRIGGSASEQRNVISGNGGNGVAILGSANGTRIEGNYIGIATDQNNMPNASEGVAMGGSGVDTAILTNSIYANGLMGIDLGLNGISPNDGGDGDGGPNRLQNFPLLSYAIASGSNTAVAGTINSNANTTYTIQFFQSPSCGGKISGGYGQGKTYLGSTNVGTNGSGNGSFSATVNGINAGAAVTATATKLGSGNPYETSEFSPCVYAPRPHPDGALIRPSGSNNIFIIQDGSTRPIGSVQVLQSYKYTVGEFKTATAADTFLPGLPGLYFKEGTVLRGSGPDVYIIDQTGAYSYIRRKVTSIDAFVSLGYTVSDIITVPDSALGLGDGPPLGVAAQHPDGAYVISPGSPQVFLIENGKKRLVGSSGVLASQRINSSMIKPATSGDQNLTQGQNLGYKEGVLLKASGPNVYIADDVDIGGGTIISKKRRVSSIESFIQLGYKASDIVSIPDSDMATLPEGPGI